MMNRLMLGIALATVLAGFVYAQPFTYQGMLKENGNPVNNNALSMTFRLYDALTGGNQIGSPYNLIVSVRDGLFTVNLNFGNVWDGSDRYLEIQVGSTVLSPRVKINPVPYASFAQRPWQTSGSNIFYTNGNVGIGTTSPFAPLSLGGGNANTKLALWQGNTASEVMGFGVAPSQFRIHLPSPSNRFSFLDAPNGNEIVTILGNGNVGIGTSSPSQRLYVVGNGVFTGHLAVGTTLISGLNRLFVVGNSYFDGNVGIGTGSPAARLSLGGGNADTKLALWQGNNAGDLMGFGVAPGQFRIHLPNASNRFSFLDAPNGNELVTILGNGNVAIGTSSTFYRLHVEGGTAFFNGDALVGGSWLSVGGGGSPRDHWRVKIEANQVGEQWVGVVVTRGSNERRNCVLSAMSNNYSRGAMAVYDELIIQRPLWASIVTVGGS